MKKILFGFFVAIVALAAFVYFNVTLNFTILAFLVILGLIFADLYFVYSPYKDGCNENEKLVFGLFFISSLVFLINWTLSNYFTPSEDVYTNSDHHAVRIDGITIKNPKDFILAGDSKKSFIDNEDFHGTMSIESCNEDNVILKLQGFSQALLSSDLGKEGLVIKQNLINPESVILVNPSDRITMSTSSDTLDLRISYGKGKSSEKCYYICSRDGVTDTISRRRILKKGYSLNSLLNEVAGDSINFQGINLLRQEIYSDGDSKDCEYYAQAPFFLEFNNKAYDLSNQKRVKKIKITSKDGTVRTVCDVAKDLGRKVSYVKLPLGKTFSIGYLGGVKSQPMTFVKKNNELHLEYLMPKYHYLSSLNKKGANTIFVTTSLSKNITDSQTLPENIMLFDFFNNEDNVFNFKKPLYISYVSGPTDQKIEFLKDRNEPFKANTNLSIPSKDNKVTWNLCVENLKETTGFINENHILFFIICLGLCCLFNMTFGKINYALKKGGTSNVYTGFTSYTIIELVGYSVMLFFMAFRLFIMWRTASFPAVEACTKYEFYHFFRNNNMLIWLLPSLNAFFAAIFSTKYILNFRKIIQVRQQESNFISEKFVFNDYIGGIISVLLLTSLLVCAEWYCFNISDLSTLVALIVIPLLVYIVVCIVYKILEHENQIDDTFCMLWDFDFMSKNKYINKIRNFKQITLVFDALLLLLLPIIAFVFTKFSFGAIGNIFVPVVLYFIAETFIWKLFPIHTLGKYNTEGISRQNGFTLLDIVDTGLIPSIINGLAFSAVLLLADSGYGLLFFTFFIWSLVVKLYDFIRSYVSYDNANINKNHIFSLYGFLVVLVAAFLVLYKYIIALFVETNVFIDGVVIGVVMLTSFWFVFSFILGVKFIPRVRLVLTSSIFLLSFAISFGLKKYVFVDHTAQRVMVHLHSPGEALANTRSAHEEKRFMEASVNDYIINAYNQEGDKVEAIGGGGTSYFNMLPHSRIGALWGAQTSDILTSRYIIAEHGKWLPVWMLLLFVLMLYYGMHTHVKYRASKMLLVQIPCLLLVHTLFVWMANSQKFIFLGQDFPLLSLHSKMSIVYFLTLMAVWISVSLLEKTEFIEELIVNTKKIVTDLRGEVIKTITKPYYNRFLGFYFVIVVVIATGVLYYMPTKNYYVGEKYDIRNLLEQTKNKLDVLNVAFAQFQKENKINTRNLSDVSSIVAKFYKNYTNEIHTILGSDTTIHYRIWENFALKGGAKNNESGSLVHVRRKNDILKFDVQEKFYNLQLPQVDLNSWRGNIVVENNQNQRENQSKNDYFEQYILPNEWCKSTGEVVILKSRGGENTIMNDSEEHPKFDMKRGYEKACKRYVSDKFNDEGLSEISPLSYIARNVMINGRRSFVYPLGEDFFWAYTFANEVSYQKANIKNRGDLFHKDITLTFDKNLTKILYKKVSNRIKKRFNSKEKNSYLSVVAADGDGKIRAMVGYNEDYVLNPNNTKRLSEIKDELYMDMDPVVEDAYFGNINLLNMKEGPGSSQKPIVWTAVASGLDFNWKNLMLREFVPVSPKVESNKYYIRSFNGERIYPENSSKALFRSLTGDENKGQGVNLRTFMTKSSNFYNAVMLYIGSFVDPEMKISKDSSSMFMPVNLKEIDDRESYDKAFPILTLKNNAAKVFRFNKDKKMSEDYSNSLLFTRLNSMFGFNNGEEVISLYKGNEISTIHDYFSNGYAFSQTPSYTYTLEDTSRMTYLRNAIHQAAVGGGAVWQVSPVAMAQFFARLVMLNKNYEITADTNIDKKEFKLFDDLSDGYKDARHDFLLGMNRVFSKDGTAKSIGAEDNGGIMKIGKYYIYGKTGTANETNSRNKNLHRLGVVITDTAIHDLPIEKLKDVKYYTVYFTARYNTYISTYGDLIREIINSESFKNYMSK